MENLNGKIDDKQEAIKDAQKQLKAAKKAYKGGGSEAEKQNVEKRKKTLERLLEQLEKLEIMKTDRDENKSIALGTSKLNYLDPRISVEYYTEVSDLSIFAWTGSSSWVSSSSCCCSVKLAL